MPNSAAAVMATLTAVVTPVPNRRMILLLNKLEMMVPHDMTADRNPAMETATPSSPYAAGHAVPRSESGSPRLMNAM